MSALLLLASSAFGELSELWACGFDVKRWCRRRSTRERLRLFRRYCNAEWQRVRESEEEEARREAIELEQSRNSKAKTMTQRDNFDFVTIEASSEAFEDIENFLVDGNGMPRQRGSDAIERFLGAEREALNFDDIEIVDGSAFRASFYEYADSQRRYISRQIGELQEGVSFTFTGRILVNCERFSINFAMDNEYDDIALHINPRLPQNYIVRNTKAHDVWGREEVSSALPFLLRRGEQFVIQVLVTEPCYMISVNGLHFAEYPHRLPYRGVSYVEVRGDVDCVNMVREQVNVYPRRSPDAVPEIATQSPDADMVDCAHIPREWRLITLKHKISDALQTSSACVSGNASETQRVGLALPYYGKIRARTLTEGRYIKIDGRVRLLPHSFYINLQHGQSIWPHPTIAFHFNPRFSKTSGSSMGKAVVCRNAWHGGSWDQEEVSELDTNLLPGKTFSLAIVCVADAFEVYVNRKFVIEYKYHMKPDIVDTVYIQGDIKLWDVVLADNCKADGKPLFQNPRYLDDYLLD